MDGFLCVFISDSNSEKRILFLIEYNNPNTHCEMLHFKLNGTVNDDDEEDNKLVTLLPFEYAREMFFSFYEITRYYSYIEHIMECTRIPSPHLMMC